MDSILKYPYPYGLERDMWCDIVNETVGYNKLFNAFCYGIAVYGGFLWFTDDDEFYIIHLDSGIIMNWYKHLGRCNGCTHDLTIEEYKMFFSSFNEILSDFGVEADEY